MNKLNAIKTWSTLALVALALIVSSCGKEEKEKKVVFPTVKTLNFEAPGTQTFSFATSHDWTLASSADWCTLSSKAGKAGDNDVSVTVSEDAWSFDAASTSLKLTMAAQTQVIAEVKLAGKAYEINAEPDTLKLTWEGDKITAVEGKITPNFDWTISTKPDWISFDDESTMTAGKAGELTNIKVAHTGTYFKEDTKGDIVFADASGEAKDTLVIICEAMPKSLVMFSLTEVQKTDLMCLYDGTKNWMANDTTAAVEEDFTFNVTANATLKVGKYTVDETGVFSPLSDENAWFYATLDSEGKVSCEVDENPNPINRKGAILLVPETLLNEAGGDWAALLDENGAVKADYTSYHAMTFTQTAAMGGNGGKNGFTVYDETGKNYPVELNKGAYVLSLKKSEMPSTLTIVPNNYPLEEVVWNTFMRPGPNGLDMPFSGLASERKKQKIITTNWEKVKENYPESTRPQVMMVHVYFDGEGYRVSETMRIYLFTKQ